MTDDVRIIIAGGGTGGHLFPAIAIADELRARGALVKFVGSKFGIEAQVLPHRGESPLLLSIRGIRRDFSMSSILTNLVFPFRFLVAYIKSVRYLRRFQPHVVVGTGGYSSGVPLLAAIRSGFKTLIQEQNSYPGITTRRLSSKVDIICTAFEEATAYLSGDIRLYGNPVRKTVKVLEKSTARREMMISETLPTLFILGGSQGSLPLNIHFQKQHLIYLQKGYQIIWQCGEAHFPGLKSLNDQKNIHIFPFIQEMGIAYSAADLVVCRAGALTLAELCYCHKASVLIPFPFAAAGHQRVNAKSMADRGAAILTPQSELSTGKLEAQIFALFENPETLPTMEKNAGLLARPDATKQIATAIMGLA